MTDVQNISPSLRQRREHLRAIASRNRAGRILRAVRRCFIVSQGEPILSADVLLRAYPRLKCFLRGHRRAAWRALVREAEPIARCRFGRGRPYLWAPKNGNSCDTMQHENTSA
jgi:hypothetical protein